jgi:hypothetical protein
MTFLELRAIKETVDVKNGGAIVYETDVQTTGPAVILMDNPTGEYSVALLSSYHPGGAVKVIMKGISSSGNKKYKVGDIIAKLMVF